MKGARTKLINEGHNRDSVIEYVFKKRYRLGASEVPFTMNDIRDAIAAVAKASPGYKENNVADLRDQFTSGRRLLPHSINRRGPWAILGRGKARYAFVKLTASTSIELPDNLHMILLPDATP